MTKKELLILVFLLIAFTTNLQAQTNQSSQHQTPKTGLSEYPYWIGMMKDHSVNFYVVQKAFNEYFKDRFTGKGSGWKQFKRWEYFMEQRVYPTGNRLNHAQVWNEIMKFREKYPNSGNPNRSDWEPLGPDTWTNITGHWNPGIGRINVIARAPFDPLTIYIGAPSGGLWKTTDEGENWEVLTDQLPVMGVSAIAIHPANPDIIYIGTGDRDANDNYSIGVLKSLDGGYTWELTGLDWEITQNRTIAKLLIHPANPDILFAATTNGIYKTTDAGINWYNVQSGDIDDMEFKPGDPNTVYAVTESFYKSTNGGESFSQISGVPNNNRAQIAVTEDNPEYVYFFSYENGIYRSENSGSSFTPRSASPTEGNQGWYDLAMAVSHENAEEVHIGEINTYKSLNGGQSWTQTTDWTWGNSLGYTHCDIHEMVFYGGTLYVGSDGLISKSTDNGSNWTDLTEGIAIRQFYRIAGSRTNPYKLMGGSQDNGTSVYTDDYWHEWLGADGMEAAIDHTNENIVYGTSQNGNFYKSNNGGNGGNVGIVQPGGGAWVTPFVMHPVDPQTLYVGTTNVRKTTSGMNSWTTISNLGSGNINNMYISESDPDYLYVSKSGTIYRTTDGGTTWENITSGLPDLFISYIAVHPLYPETVAVSLSGFDDGDKVYISYDAGNTWENYSENLPNIPANCVIFNNDEHEGIYVGMDVGIYYRDNTLDEWEPFSEGIPNVIINEMEIHYESGKIRAGTYGRGLWESDIHPVVPLDIVITYTVNAGDDDIIEFGETVSLDVQLKNTMEVAAQDLDMTISFNGQYINITDSNEFFGTIQPGDSVLIAGAFSFDVTTNVPDNYSVNLTTLTTSSVDLWEGTIKLKAYAPVVEPGLVVVNDGGNGYLDPGETALIEVAIVNSGSLTANAINLDISTIDPFVTISNTTAYIDVLDPAASEVITFDITVDETAPPGHIIMITFDITAAEGYATTAGIGLVVGLIVEDYETGDFSKYPWAFDGNANWYVVNSEMYEGEYSTRSGSIDDEEESILTLELDILYDGEISFYKKVSCENDPNGTGYDYLAFRVDDDEKGRWDNEVPWSLEVYPISAGLHTLSWVYHKDYSVNSGSDCAWIDYILFPAFDNGLPQLYLNPESLAKTMPPDQTDIDTLMIANIGGGLLEYSIEITGSFFQNPLDPVSWLSINPVSGSLNGGEQDDLQLTFNTTGLSEGDYSCLIIVTDNLSNQTEIPVMLTVDIGIGIADPDHSSAGNPVAVFPNPFTNETTISFQVFEKAEISLEIFDIKGEKVKTLLLNTIKDKGTHSMLWDGTSDNQNPVPGGVYFYRLNAGKQYTGRIVVVK
ncbi:MAG: T9SS type A sorting domain-containing protein [Bacteroidales bacterium]|nr:T9SS type A sorting domain-containing protein [Bacteroidales bacterium]